MNHDSGTNMSAFTNHGSAKTRLKPIPLPSHYKKTRNRNQERGNGWTCNRRRRQGSCSQGALRRRRRGAARRQACYRTRSWWTTSRPPPTGHRPISSRPRQRPQQQRWPRVPAEAEGRSPPEATVLLPSSGGSLSLVGSMEERRRQKKTLRKRRGRVCVQNLHTLEKTACGIHMEDSLFKMSLMGLKADTNSKNSKMESFSLQMIS